MFIDLSASMKAEELRIQRDRIEDFMAAIPVDWKLTCYKIGDDLFPDPLFDEFWCITEGHEERGERALDAFRKKRVTTVMDSVETLLPAPSQSSTPSGDERPERPSCVTGALSALVRKQSAFFDSNTYVIFFGDMLEECELANVGRVDLNAEGAGESYFKALASKVDSLYKPQGQLSARLPADHLTFVVTCKNINPGRGVLAAGVQNFWDVALNRFGYEGGSYDMFVGAGEDAAVRFWPENR